ncbi:MAG: hypothetical protein RML72_06345 [Bacteroidia bacterium]|nr:hypothetical protein [Bacteroidia bacterium]
MENKSTQLNCPASTFSLEPTIIEQKIARLRICMTIASESEPYFREGKKILETLKGVQEKKAEIEAYAAAFTALKAKHTSSPLEKLNAVNKALPVLLKLARENPFNVEILFVKTAVFSRLPFFFQRTKEALEDIEKLIQMLERQWHSLQDSLRNVIIEFLLTSSLASYSQKQRVKQCIKKSYSSPSSEVLA